MRPSQTSWREEYIIITQYLSPEQESSKDSGAQKRKEIKILMVRGVSGKNSAKLTEIQEEEWRMIIEKPGRGGKQEAA